MDGSHEPENRRRTRAAIALTTLSVVAVPAIALGARTHEDNTQQARQSIVGGKARNVIMLLGDGGRRHGRQRDHHRP